MKDTRIIELFFERDQQAIQELDTKYGKVCHKLSYNIVNNRYDAEECVNDAYLGAWNTIPPTKPQSLQAYICKIVRNISLKLLYRNEAAKRKSVCEVAMQEMEAYLPAQNTVEAEIEAKELVICSFDIVAVLSVDVACCGCNPLRRGSFSENAPTTHLKSSENAYNSER